MERPRVLFVASLCGHLTAFHLPHMQTLMDMGYEVHAAARASSARSKLRLEELGVRVFDFPIPRSPFSLRTLSVLRRLRELMMHEQYALIHVHTPVAAFLGRLAARLTHQQQILYTVHGFHFHRGAPLRNWLLYYPLERLAVNWTHGLIVINAEDRQMAERLGFGKPGRRLYYVPGVGVDIEHYAPCSKTPQRVHPFVVTCVAELNPNKNHIFLLQAWAQFSTQHSDAHLYLVGSGPLKDQLQSFCDTRGINNVHLLGYRRDVPELLQVSDIVVLVSQREGLPRSLMEAMAAGKPIVASDIRGNRDLVAHHDTGILVKLGDVTGLTAALARLYGDAELRMRMGQRARERVQAFSLSAVAADMRRVYEHYLAPLAGQMSGMGDNHGPATSGRDGS